MYDFTILIVELLLVSCACPVQMNELSNFSFFIYNLLHLPAITCKCVIDRAVEEFNWKLVNIYYTFLYKKMLEKT